MRGYVVRDREPERLVVNVVGERVALGPLQRDLLPTSGGAMTLPPWIVSAVCHDP